MEVDPASENIEVEIVDPASENIEVKIVEPRMKIEGYLLNNTETEPPIWDTYVFFLGIPYAQPPMGEKRFQRPKDIPEFLPVLVYFHEGGFSHGSGNYDRRTPESPMKHDIVLVTVNYRFIPKFYDVNSINF